jgi:hypothetical protein
VAGVRARGDGGGGAPAGARRARPVARHRGARQHPDRGRGHRPWSAAAPAGSTYPWQDSFCLRMVERRGPVAAPDVTAIPSYAELAVGPLAAVRSYVGVPLEGDDGRSSARCAASPASARTTRGRAPWAPCASSAACSARSSAREQFAHDRSQEAAQAYALVELDPATGLRNRRGWDAASAGGHPLPALRPTRASRARPRTRRRRTRIAAAQRCCRSCRPVTSWRAWAQEFAVLALECDLVAARALHAPCGCSCGRRPDLRDRRRHPRTGSGWRTPGQAVASRQEPAPRARA